MSALRSLILGAAGNDTIRGLVTTAPVARQVVSRFVAGVTTADAIAAAARLVAAGLLVSLDHLGENTTDPAAADASVRAYEELLTALAAAGLAEHTEVSLKLSAVGRLLDPALAVRNAARICAAAQRAGSMVTLDMEDHTSTDATLAAAADLRRGYPDVGVVVQAYLRRTEADCRELTGAGVRVRLCKGAYAEPDTVAHRDPHQVDLSYLRCANVLLAGDGYPMLATHDPRLLPILAERVRWYERAQDSFEYQMLYGIRPREQRRLAATGDRMRVYVPYGQQWYCYLMRRLAERPANLALLLRALVSRG